MARYKNNNVLLRWAPTTPTAWLKANKYGYKIERYTLFVNGKRLQTPIKKILNTTPIQPEPLEKWEQFVDKNDQAAILAQALYGESFSVEDTDSKDGLMKIANQVEEIEQRFSFALFAADMNFEAAKKAGLGFEDTTVKTNEKYFYTITAIVPEELLKIEKGSVSITTTKSEPLPAPTDLYAVSGNKNILLTWEYESYKSIYTSYFVERTDDNSTFKRLGDTPLVNLNNNPNSPAKKMYYMDTIPQNNKLYQYRVIGISPFGEEGLPSKSVASEGIDDAEFTPHIKGYTVTEKGTVNIEWEFPKEAEHTISGFELNRAPEAKGPFKTVQINLLPNKRTTEHLATEPSNYYTITAIGKNKKKRQSLTTFVQLIDSIAPLKPIGLKGVIDSLGIVKITWQPNKETDLLGYRIFKGNRLEDEFSQITISPTEQITFTDTLKRKSLNKAIYYKIVAVDKRFNMSDYSDVLTLVKPDLTKPSSPIFSSYKTDNNTIYLEWIASGEKNIVHKLYRQEVAIPENKWELMYEGTKENTYADTKTISNKKYRYAIYAENENKTQSSPSPFITLSTINTSPQNIIKNFFAASDRANNQINILWQTTNTNVSEIVLYKSKLGEKPQLLRQFPAIITEFNDKNIHPSNTYTYHIKALLNNGEQSTTEKIDVIY